MHMSSKERIKRIKMRIERNKKYRMSLYNFYCVILIITILLPAFFLCEMFLVKLESKYNMSLWLSNVPLCAFFVCTAVLLFLIHYRKQKNLIYNGRQLETNIQKDNMLIVPPGRGIMGTYHFVSYYVDKNRTYQFRCKVKDDQLVLYNIFTELEEKGAFPKLVVVVNPRNYNQYEALGYKFLLDTLEMNEELVEKILDKMYAKEWNFTC